MPLAHDWDLQRVRNHVCPRATFGGEPFASRLMAAPDQVIVVVGEWR